MPNELSRPLEILVCDDDPDTRDTFASLLELRGYRVCRTTTGTEALTALRSGAFSLALLDIGLPDISGYEVAETVIAELGARAPMFIAVTGYGQPADRTRAAEAGFSLHILKPATAAVLFQAVSATIQ